MTIGILDDHDDSRYFLRCWLESENYQVKDWSRAADFLQHLEQNDLNLALVDLWLPDVNGLLLPNLIRDRCQKEVPLVALTAHVVGGIRDQAISAGFRDYLVKPVDFEALKRVIRELSESSKA